MGTIVQEYGPIYGEVVNGTVSGRPNGSVYVPEFNAIEWLTEPATIKYDSDRNRLYVYDSNGGEPRYAAKSQDLASCVKAEVYSDAELTTMIAARTRNAGLFNNTWHVIGYNLSESNPLTPGDTYYIVQTLVNNGVVVAASVVREVEAVA